MKINSMISRGRGPTEIAREVGGVVSAEAIHRHKTAGHQFKRPSDAQGDSTAELDKWLARAETLWIAAEKKKDIAKMSAAMMMAHKFTELRMKKLGEILTDSARREKEAKEGKKDQGAQPLSIEFLDQLVNKVKGRTQ